MKAPAKQSRPIFELIRAAKERLQGYANKTPLMTSRTLTGLTGADVYLKCENFQRVGHSYFVGRSMPSPDYPKSRDLAGS